MTRPSRTAQSVALAVLTTSHEPEWAWLVPPDVAEPIRACLRAVPGMLGMAYRILDRPGALRLIRWAERRSIPRARLHVAVRKRWIEREVRRAIERGGATQVVIVGAGFDPLGWRLRSMPGVDVWEIDRRETQAVKQAGLARLGPAGPQLHFVAADLARDKLGALLAQSPAFSADRRTVVVAEGVLMYLPEPVVAESLRGFRALVGEGGVVVGTALAPGPDGRLTVAGAPRSVDRRLRRFGEPFRFGMPPGDLAAFAGRLGFDRCATISVPEAAREIARSGTELTGIPELGEYLFRLQPGAGPA